ncbi:MAG: autotransporter domain-containing protein [Betaproteobacteria bacterium]|nr:autotransporter domain-containing protein [Betaproteobacteria bacterium]
MFKRSLIAAAAASLFSVPASADYSGTVFFGDSLTDGGFYTPLLPPGTGRFTTNPGPVWAELFASALGGTAAPSNVAGGTNYAQGGARVTGTPGVGSPPATGAQPIQVQVTNYLASRGGAADGNTLYTVWAGANDVFVALGLPSADIPAYVVTTAGQAVTEIARLRAAGARYILVPTVPDIGATPFATTLPPGGAAGATQITSTYNQALFGGLSAAGISVIPLDTFALLREVQASPAAYGFVNVAVPACTTVSSLICTAATLAAPDAAQTFLFADGVHPTTAAHRIISDYALATLAAPRAMSLLAESPIKTRALLSNAIGDQLLLDVLGPGTGTRAWASLGAGRLRYDGNSADPGGSGDPLALTVGVDRALWPGMTVGAAFSSGRLKERFAGTGGAYEQTEQVLALYAGARNGPWYVNVVGALGYLAFDTERSVALGIASRSATGSTRGSSLSLGAQGGWLMTQGALSHGPIAGLQVQRIRVDGFTETGGSLALTYESQTRQSAVASLGYEARYHAGNLLPFARLALNHELTDNDRTVRAAMPSILGSGLEMAAIDHGRNWGTLALGLGAKLAANVTGSLSLGTQFGQDKVRQHWLQAGVSVGF